MSSPPLTIVATPGYSREVGRLVAMLAYARATTLHAVRGLTPEQLDHRHDDRSNSIGVLLAHLSAVEWFYQIQTFEQRAPTPEELKPWEPALDLGPAAWEAIRGRPLSHYLEELATVRARTLVCFRQVDDSWLDILDLQAGGPAMNRYWQWFHVCEDELSHRGQIRWLRARLPA